MKNKTNQKNNILATKQSLKNKFKLLIFPMAITFFCSHSVSAVIGGKADPNYDVPETQQPQGAVHALKTEFGGTAGSDKLKESHPALIGTINSVYKIPIEELNKFKPAHGLDLIRVNRERSEGAGAQNTYDINIYAASFSVSPKDKPTPQDTDDYYDILLEFKPTASPVLAKDFILPKEYQLQVTPRKFLLASGTLVDKGSISMDVCKLDAWEWCPLNATDRKTSYTESMQFTLSGSFGGGFPAAGTGTVSPNFSVGHQYTRDIMDIDVVSTMNLNKAQWNIHYNRLSLDQKNGFLPEGTIKQTLRWVWKVNREEAENHLYAKGFAGEDSTQLYFPLQLELLAGFASMHHHGKQLEQTKSDLLQVVKDTVLIKIPPLPKGKSTAVKTPHNLTNL